MFRNWGVIVRRIWISLPCFGWQCLLPMIVTVYQHAGDADMTMFKCLATISQVGSLHFTTMRWMPLVCLLLYDWVHINKMRLCNESILRSIHRFSFERLEKWSAGVMLWVIQKVQDILLVEPSLLAAAQQLVWCFEWCRRFRTSSWWSLLF